MSEEFIQSSELRKLQLVELDIFKQFRSVCEKHGLKYYADGGTLIGAARHQGFIPWDDDMDINMMWDDYKVFMEVAPQEFKEPYFFQDYRTEPFFGPSSSKIRNSDTCAITKWEYENIQDKNYNRGVFIDIFPLFNVPDDEETRRIQKEEIMSAWRAMRGWNAIQNQKVGKPTIYTEYIDDYTRVSDKYTIREIRQKYMDACAMIKVETEEVGVTSYRTHADNFIWRKEWFDETVELPFEDTTISCAKHYDEILTKTFDDWRVPVYDGSAHEMYIYDTERSYKEMI